MCLFQTLASGRKFLPQDWVYTSLPSDTKEYAHSGVLGIYGLWHGCTCDVITSVSYVHACTHGVAEKVHPHREPFLNRKISNSALGGLILT